MTDRTLLLVDDEENILSALNRAFRGEGYRVLRADSGPQGLELLSQYEVGVIISDQRMPGMTGTEFLTRARELYPDTVRMVLSGYTDLNTVIDAINRGAVYKFLIKPWDDELLRNSVKESFERYEMKAENLRLARALQAANDALSFMNKDLEKSVADKSREIVRNWRVLQVTQEMLAQLPFGVIAVDEDDMVVVANRLMPDLLNAVEGDFIGLPIDKALPDGLLGFYRSAKLDGEPVGRFDLPGAALALARFVRLGKPSEPYGAMLVITVGCTEK